MGFRIGDIEITVPVALGPMAGITDLPFRLLCTEQGAGLLYTEMVSAKGVMYHNPNTAELIATDPAEQPIGLQLFGADPKILSEQAKVLSELPFAFFDVNMGCPVPKVVNNGEGSALMKDPKLVYDIVSAMVKAQSKPVTVKIRKGFGGESAAAVAKAAEDAGASAIAVHGVMIARAARGNPWIFAQCKAFLTEGRVLPKPTDEELCGMVLRHARMACEFKGEKIAMKEMRSHVAWYFTGRRGSAGLRRAANAITTYDGLSELVGEWLSHAESQENRG